MISVVLLLSIGWLCEKHHSLHFDKIKYRIAGNACALPNICSWTSL